MNTQKLLLVDDEPNVIKSLKRLFIDDDYKILTAESGEEALAICAENDVQLVISDYRMPSMNGVQLLAIIKEKYPKTIRIILSGYADVSAIVDAINEGQVYKFLSKPWNDQELLTTVRRAFEHFALQQQHDALVGELRLTNDELKSLTKSLEEKVAERTRDLDIKNRALEITRFILDLLPVGVVGVDTEHTVVYLNKSTSEFVRGREFRLGETVSDALDPQVLNLLRKTVGSSDNVVLTCKTEEGFGVICTPLADGAGAVATFIRKDLNDYSGTSDNAQEKAGIAHEQ